MLAGGLRRGMAGLLLGLAGALAAVVPPTGILPANAQSTGEFFDYPQTLLNGTVSATVSVPLKSCRNLCFARSGCIGFDYSSSDGVCRLFANVAGAGESRHTSPEHAVSSWATVRQPIRQSQLNRHRSGAKVRQKRKRRSRKAPHRKRLASLRRSSERNQDVKNNERRQVSGRQQSQKRPHQIRPPRRRRHVRLSSASATTILGPSRFSHPGNVR